LPPGSGVDEMLGNKFKPQPPDRYPVAPVPAAIVVG